MKKILFILVSALPFAALAQTAKDTVNVVTDAEIAEGTTADTLKMYFIQGDSWKKTRLDSIARYTRVKLAGNKGDITVSGATGDTWSINSGAVTWDDLSQPVKDSIGAGGTGGSGTVQSITAGAGLTGGTITVSGTIAADTANVLASKAWTNAGLALKLNISDTTTMLSPYLKEADTTAMLVPYLRKADTSAMLAPYLKIIDTTTMLSPYLKEVDTTAMLVPYLRKVDTTAMLVPYLRDADTTAMLSSYFRKDKISAEFTIKSPDTLALSQQSAANGQVLAWNGSRWAPASVGGSGTVQSITSGYGLTADVNPITTSGTITVDTSYIVDTFRLKNAINSILTNPMTTQGDIIVAGTSGAPGRLGIGTAGQLLKVNTGATGLEYFTPTYLTAEVDGSVTNEGSLSVLEGSSTTSIIRSNTSGSTDITLTSGLGIGISEVGNNITFSNLGVVGVSGTSPIVSSGGTTPAISLASGYGDTQNPYASKAANLFLASPNGTTGVPTFRSIAVADVPTLNQNTTGTASNVTGTVAIANGGTGATNAANARLNLGASILGGNLFTITDPSAVTFPRFNANNTVSALSASDFRTAIGAGTVTSIATNNGITGGTITGSGTIGLDGQALALHNLSTNGFVTRTGANTFAGRTITGTTNQIIVSNGDGVVTNPTISLPSAIQGVQVTSSGSSVALNSTSSHVQRYTGSLLGTFDYLLPNTNTLIVGRTFIFKNDSPSTTPVAIKTVAPSANLIATIPPGHSVRIIVLGVGGANDATEFDVTYDGNEGQQIVTTSNADVLFLRRDINTNGSSIRQLFNAKNSTGDYATYAAILGNIVSNTAGSNSGSLQFLTTSSAGSGLPTIRATLDENGNFGINQASSIARTLHVNGEVRITDLTTDNPTRLVGADADGDLSEVTLGSGLAFDGTTIKKQEAMVIACSDETTNLTTGTAKVTFRAPFAMTITGVRANVNTAPVGSTIIVDINKGDTPASIFDTRLSIDASEKTSTTAASAAVIASGGGTITDDQQITIDIDQVGSTTAGKGLKVTIYYTR